MKEDVLKKVYTVWFYSESIKLFLEGLNKYIDYLSKWNNPGNEKLQEKLTGIKYFRESLQSKVKSGENWHINLTIEGSALALLKSTQQYLLADAYEEKKKLISENAPAEGMEYIDRKIERIKELMVTGVMGELPIEQIMGKLDNISEPEKTERPFPLLLDDKLQDVVREISENGENNDRSVNDALTELEDRIRKASGLKSSDFGQRLIDKAFRPQDGILILSEEANEQQAYWKLYDGFLGTFKNSTSHRRIEDISSERAIQIVQFADYLISLLQTAKVRS